MQKAIGSNLSRLVGSHRRLSSSSPSSIALQSSLINRAICSIDDAIPRRQLPDGSSRLLHGHTSTEWLRRYRYYHSSDHYNNYQNTIQHQESRYYTSSSIQQEESKVAATINTETHTTEKSVQVKVTKSSTTSTKESSMNPSNEEKSNEDETESSNDDDANPFSPTQKQAEEELSTLQSHVKTHYQHANYTEALQVSEEILSTTLELYKTAKSVEIPSDIDDLGFDISKDAYETDDIRAHPAVASAHNNIGLMHKMLGNYSKSRIHYNKALWIYASVVGTDHASYATTLNNLGNLDRTQSQLDDGIVEPDQIRMVARAVSYFEKAYEINLAELGKENVHTLTSLSNLGGSIAIQVLQSEWLRVSGKNKSQDEPNGLQKGEEQSKQQDDKDADTPDDIDSVIELTQNKWDIAERHLRAAFRTAVNHPRGEEVVPAPHHKSNMNAALKAKLPKRDKSKSKKEKRKDAKIRRKIMKQMEKENNGNSGPYNQSYVSKLGYGDTQIRTVSASNAAQNLAVFLKSRADLLVREQASGSSSATTSLDSGDLYAEAKNLYLGALYVRSKLRGEYHPDTVTTKFSLAELIEMIGDKTGAQTLREEILKSYDIEERDEDGEATAVEK